MTNVAVRSTLLLCFKPFMTSYLSFEELIAIIPIPWNCPFPVNVWMLWSTLSATHWTKFVTWSSSVLFTLTANCLNKSLGQMILKSQILLNDQQTTLYQRVGAITDLGIEACAMHCWKLNCFNFDGKRCPRNICKFSGTHFFFHNPYCSCPLMKGMQTYALEFLWCHF